MFNLKTYERAGSVAEAVALLERFPGTRLIAGGTDVLIQLREGKITHQHLVDIHDLDELKGITMTKAGAVEIGAGVTFTRLMASEVIQTHVPVLATAAGSVGGPQIRNVATIGGNLCNGVTSADSAPPLLALDAVLKIQGPGGARTVAMREFYRGPGQVALDRAEILAAVLVPAHGHRNIYGHFIKYAAREAMDIATVSCAAALAVSAGTAVDVRLAFGVAAPVPIRCPKTEQVLRGCRIDDAFFRRMREVLPDDVRPRTSWRASREFRLHILKEIADRALRQAATAAGGAEK